MQGLFFILISAFKGGRGEKNLNRKCTMSAYFCLLLEISQRDYSLILSQYILLGDKSESNHTLHDGTMRLLIIDMIPLLFLFFLKIKWHHFKSSVFLIKSILVMQFNILEPINFCSWVTIKWVLM